MQQFINIAKTVARLLWLEQRALILEDYHRDGVFFCETLLKKKSIAPAHGANNKGKIAGAMITKRSKVNNIHTLPLHHKTIRLSKLPGPII